MLQNCKYLGRKKGNEKFHAPRNNDDATFREYLLSFSPKYFVFRFAI
jgi:hypothetical protein